MKNEEDDLLERWVSKLANSLCGICTVFIFLMFLLDLDGDSYPTYLALSSRIYPFKKATAWTVYSIIILLHDLSPYSVFFFGLSLILWTLEIENVFYNLLTACLFHLIFILIEHRRPQSLALSRSCPLQLKDGIFQGGTGISSGGRLHYVSRGTPTSPSFFLQLPRWRYGQKRRD